MAACKTTLTESKSPMAKTPNTSPVAVNSDVVPHDAETGEITNPTAPAAPNPFAADVVQVKRRVTEATFTFENGMAIICRFLVPIHEGEEVKEGARGPRYGKAYVTSIQSPNGDVRNLVTGTILRTELIKAYPNDSYVGEWFQIEKHKPKTDKDYSTYTITEIYKPEGAPELDLSQFKLKAKPAPAPAA